MKFLSTFKITKGFDTWLKMYKEIEPDLNELGIKILWAGTNSDEIIEKELSLSGVQSPITEDQLAGDFINWFKFGDFSGYLIEKPA